MNALTWWLSMLRMFQIVTVNVKAKEPQLQSIYRRYFGCPGHTPWVHFWPLVLITVSVASSQPTHQTFITPWEAQTLGYILLGYLAVDCGSWPKPNKKHTKKLLISWNALSDQSGFLFQWGDSWWPPKWRPFTRRTLARSLGFYPHLLSFGEAGEELEIE